MYYLLSLQRITRAKVNTIARYLLAIIFTVLVAYTYIENYHQNKQLEVKILIKIKCYKLFLNGAVQVTCKPNYQNNVPVLTSFEPVSYNCFT